MNGLPKKTLIAGVGLIVVVNAIVLGGVAYNRSGEPESALHLSDRELTAPTRWYGNKENSGLALALNWRVLPPAPHDPNKHSWASDGTADWLNEAKMVALGFEKSMPNQYPDKLSRIREPLPKDVLLVLELDGPAYQAALARAVKSSEGASAEAKTPASDALKREQHESSRLFVVDAGLDVAALRAQYPDRSRYAIVHGQVRANWRFDQNGAALAGFVSHVSPESVHVPLDWRQVFEGASAVRGDGPSPVAYAVEVKFGQRLEPWISQARRVTPSAPR
jgi:hypothetical protein